MESGNPKDGSDVPAYDADIDIIAFFGKIATVGLDDFNNSLTFLLVDLTMKFGFYTLGCKTNQIGRASCRERV